MKYFYILLTSLLFFYNCYSQERIDGNFSFQTDDAKKYSLYIPSGYDSATPHRLMLGLHPLNTNRWDAISWCDTLIAFAETNQLILACPDGGIDGAVDDPIDIAFTDALLDSMEVWYNINSDKTYAMGFSWGAKTTYTYGMNNAARFSGFLPIGSAMNGTSEVNGVISNWANKPVYIVHGANDSPSSRFNPIKSALETEGAIVNSLLMSGVGHTIDFPNRNAILTTAFQWIDSINCDQVLPINEINHSDNTLFSILPNPIQHGKQLEVHFNLKTSQEVSFILMDQNGRYVKTFSFSQLLVGDQKLNFDLIGLDTGMYYLSFEEKNGHQQIKKFVLY